MAENKGNSVFFMAMHLITHTCVIYLVFNIFGVQLKNKVVIVYLSLHAAQDVLMPILYKLGKTVKMDYSAFCQFIDQKKYADDYLWHAVIGFDHCLHIAIFCILILTL